MAERSNITLLVIDDDPDVLRATARVLEQAGYRVFTGASAAQALELTCTLQPAILLLDVDLPDGNGVDVARQVKQDPALASVCVILVSGKNTSGADQAKGLETGLADGYVTRPYSKPEFLARIDAALRLRSTQESLRDALNRIHTITSLVPGMVYQFRLRPDGTSCFPFASEGIRAIYGVRPDEVREDSSKLFALLHPDDAGAVMASVQRSADELTPWQQEYRVISEAGTVRWVLGNAIPQRETDGGCLWHGFISDITEQRAMQDQLRLLAFYDELTQLPNRRLLHDRLKQAVVASKRSGRYGALMLLDLDNFKALNDTHGHPAGDLLLREAAQRLKGCVRESDTVARLGGDEFVVMIDMLDVDRPQSVVQAAAVAEKIRTAMANPYRLDVPQRDGRALAIDHRCSASIGVVMFVRDAASPDELLKWADTGMYQAKHAGRDQVRFFPT